MRRSLNETELEILEFIIKLDGHATSEEFGMQFDLDPTDIPADIEDALKILQMSGYITYNAVEYSLSEEGRRYMAYYD